MEKRDIELIRALQKEDIFKTRSPFKCAAEMLGWDIEEVLDRSRRLKEAGVIRRFGAALTPANAGFTSNALVLWDVEEEKAQDAGEAISKHPRVSHCYIRPRFEGFRYNVYSMVHANSPEDLDSVIEELSSASGAKSFKALRSIKEFKKSSPVYFP